MNEHLTTLREMREDDIRMLEANTFLSDSERAFIEKRRDALDAAILALELLEAADTFDIYFNGVGEIRKTEFRRTILARKFGDPDVKTEHDSPTAAYSALKEKK